MFLYLMESKKVSTTVVPSCHVRYNLPIKKSNHNDCGLFHCWTERNRTTSCV